MKHKAIPPFLLLFALACGQELPTIPDVPPAPQPSPTPRPFVPLQVDDLNADLKSAVNCCAPPPPLPDLGIIHRWPFFDMVVLELYARAGVRLTEVRLGPTSPSSTDPGPEESLRLFDEWARAALPHGLTLLAGLYDGWPARHGLNFWDETCAVMQRAPREHHLEWVRRVVEVANRNPNTLLFDGNETFVCRPSREWVEGLESAVRAAGYTRPFGSNAELGIGDFQVHHGFRQVEAGSILLESDNRDHSVESWLALRASSGGAVAYWRGPMTWEEWERLLLSDVDPACEPPPVCPAARKMGVQLHTDAGRLLVFNITPKFAYGGGMRPCNDEHRESCSSGCGAWRECEPPQEPEFTVEGNHRQARLQGNNRYLLNVADPVGPITVTTCWNGGSTDAHGVPLDLSRAECDSVTVP